MTRIPAPVLRLLNEDMVAPAEGPGQHLRNAIQLLILADERLAEWLPAADPQVVELLRAAEARCFRALFLLGQEDA